MQRLHSGTAIADFFSSCSHCLRIKTAVKEFMKTNKLQALPSASLSRDLTQIQDLTPSHQELTEDQDRALRDAMKFPTQENHR